jgi:hypothetical protein
LFFFFLQQYSNVPKINHQFTIYPVSWRLNSFWHEPVTCTPIDGNNECHHDAYTEGNIRLSVKMEAV